MCWPFNLFKILVKHFRAILYSFYHLTLWHHCVYPYPYKTHLTYSNGNYFARIGLGSSIIYSSHSRVNRKKKIPAHYPNFNFSTQPLSELLWTYGSGHRSYLYSKLMALKSTTRYVYCKQWNVWALKHDSNLMNSQPANRFFSLHFIHKMEIEYAWYMRACTVQANRLDKQRYRNTNQLT